MYPMLYLPLETLNSALRTSGSCEPLTVPYEPVMAQGTLLHRVFHKSVPEPSSSGAAKNSEVYIYPNIAAKAVSSIY